MKNNLLLGWANWNWDILLRMIDRPDDELKGNAFNACQRCDEILEFPWVEERQIAYDSGDTFGVSERFCPGCAEWIDSY